MESVVFFSSDMMAINISTANNTQLFGQSVHDTGSPEVGPGDAVWILTSAFIIFTMISGFGLVESGETSRYLYSYLRDVKFIFKISTKCNFSHLGKWRTILRTIYLRKRTTLSLLYGFVVLNVLKLSMHLYVFYWLIWNTRLGLILSQCLWLLKQK